MEIAWRSRAFADESSSSASMAIVTTTSTRRHVDSACGCPILGSRLLTCCFIADGSPA